MEKIFLRNGIYQVKKRKNFSNFIQDRFFHIIKYQFLNTEQKNFFFRCKINVFLFSCTIINNSIMIFRSQVKVYIYTYVI